MFSILLKCCFGFSYMFWFFVKNFFLFQWKVRRTLAFSIHELAVILGETITTEDLVPIFNEFLKDLDEVKIGAVKHLADFIKVKWRKNAAKSSKCSTDWHSLLLPYMECTSSFCQFRHPQKTLVVLAVISVEMSSSTFGSENRVQCHSKVSWQNDYVRLFSFDESISYK